MSAPVDVIAILDSQIAELRASGNTGNVQNLLDAKAQVIKMLAALKQCEHWFNNRVIINQCFSDPGEKSPYMPMLTIIRSTLSTEVGAK